MTTDRPLTSFAAVADLVSGFRRKHPKIVEACQQQAPRRAVPSLDPLPGVVESFENGFWIVRFGPGITDIERLRSFQFCFSATNPCIRPNPQHGDRLDGRDIWPGMRVELHYIVARGSGLMYAYPTTQDPGTPPATA